jgi:hypothetical protein
MLVAAEARQRDLRALASDARLFAGQTPFAGAAATLL